MNEKFLEVGDVMQILGISRSTVNLKGRVTL